MANHNDLGNYGEEKAVQYLIDQGYKILARNWRFRSAELDIIALKDNTLSIVEVKTRSSVYFGEPQLFINKKKKERIIEATQAYIEKNEIDLEVQFDIIAIVWTKNKINIHHILSAFSIFG